jgi:hypothetical protein
VVGCHEHGNELLVPQKAGNVLKNRSTISFSRGPLLEGVKWLLVFSLEST